jgi:hypothetical protein
MASRPRHYHQALSLISQVPPPLVLSRKPWPQKQRRQARRSMHRNPALPCISLHATIPRRRLRLPRRRLPRRRHLERRPPL